MEKRKNADGSELRNATKSRRKNVKSIDSAQSRSSLGELCDEKKKRKGKFDSADRSTKPPWPTKEFKLQNSYLTEAFKTLDIRCLRHVSYVAWSMWIIRLIVVDYTKNKTFQLPGMPTLTHSVGGIQYWLFSHIIFLLLALLLGAGLQIWYSSRNVFNNSSLKIFDNISAVFLISYMSALVLVPWHWLLFNSKQGPFIKMWIVGEQVRICMKMIAYVSTKICHALEETATVDDKTKLKSDRRKNSSGPSLIKLLYFLYAPTIVYSDEYPRKNKVRWSFVLENLFDLLLIFYSGFVIYEKELRPSVLSYLLKQEPKSFILLMFETSLPFVILLVLAMIGLWHSMQNLFAEVLCFGDRRFYSDWWNEGTASGFHRTNNIVVQDWLYYYIYCPVKRRTQSTVTAQMMVLFVSAVVHDIMIGLALDFGLPLISSNFITVALLLRFSKKDGRRDAWSNFVYLMTFPCGASFMGCFLAAEYYARKECLRTIESSWDYFYPRFWNCKIIN